MPKKKLPKKEYKVWMYLSSVLLFKVLENKYKNRSEHHIDGMYIYNQNHLILVDGHILKNKL